MENQNEERSKDVFALSERNGRTYWLRIGKAFTNRDNSSTILLDALPVSGKLQLRDAVPRDGATPRPLGPPIGHDAPHPVTSEPVGLLNLTPFPSGREQR